MKKKLVILDMDGVIIDSERVSDQVWKQLFTKHDLMIGETDRLSFIGKDDDAITKYVKEKYQGHYYKTFVQEWFDLYIAHEKKFGIPIKEGVFDYINHLKSKGIKLAVASTTSSKVAIDFLRKANVYHLMDYHMFGDMVTKHKPDPLIYNKVIEYFGVKKHEALIFEDSYSGVKAANNAGIDVILVDDFSKVSHKKGIHFVDTIESFKQCYDKCDPVIFG